MTFDNPLFATYVCLSFYFGGLMTLPIVLLIKTETHGSILTPMGSLAYFWTLVM